MCRDMAKKSFNFATNHDVTNAIRRGVAGAGLYGLAYTLDHFKTCIDKD